MSNLAIETRHFPEGIEAALSLLIPDAILLLNRDGTIVFANRNAGRLLRYRNSELVNNSIDILLPEDLREHHAKLRQTYLTHPVSRPMGNGSNFIARRKDGTLLPVEIMLSPLDWNGASLTVAFVRDITARKNAEEALLREKERIETTLACISDAVVTTDQEGRITYLNPMAEKLCGWTNAEANERPFSQVVNLINDTTHESISAAVQKGLSATKLRALLDEHADHTLLIHRGGQEIPIADSVALIRDPRGNEYGAVIVFRDVTERRRLNQQLYYQSTHDPLTHLINRCEFERRLRRVLGEEKPDPHAVLYLDLDQFKIVNDTCGHTAGDALLRQIASRLQSVVRQRDTLARLGGDEFGVLLEHCSPTQAERVANNLRDAVQTFPFIWNNQRFSVGVSIGLASIPEAGNTLTEVLCAADAACYAAKDTGRNRVHRYQNDDHDLNRRQDQKHWIPRLQKALDERQFRLFCQPIVSLQSHGETPGYSEILLRLQEEESMILPSTFIPAAERFDRMQALDRWVVKEVLDYLRNRSDGAVPCCAINVSGQSLSDLEFLAFVSDLVRRSGVKPSQLCFEITETAAIAHLSRAQNFISTLKDLGCRFALDDFGSGLSSFSYLKNLPVDFLKIDGGFIRELVNDPVDLAMVKSIHDIAQVMNIRTIAESVENTVTLDVLKKIGIDFAQGYGIEKPFPLNV